MVRQLSCHCLAFLILQRFRRVVRKLKYIYIIYNIISITRCTFKLWLKHSKQYSNPHHKLNNQSHSKQLSNSHVCPLASMTMPLSSPPLESSLDMSPLLWIKNQLEECVADHACFGNSVLLAADSSRHWQPLNLFSKANVP